MRPSGSLQARPFVPTPPHLGAFERATTIERAGTRLVARATEDWYQGGGVYGGVVMGIAARALEGAVDDPTRPLISLQVTLAAPMHAGEVEVRPRVARAGKSVTFAACDLLQGDQVVALATSVHGAPRRPDDDFLHAAPPVVHAPQDVPAWPSGPPFPTFTRHVECRQAFGSPPGASADEALVGGWCRMREPAPVDAALLAALLDAWPPAIFSRLDGLRAAATISATLHVWAPLPDAFRPDDLVLVTSRSEVARGGYVGEDEALWTQDGRLVATGRQVIALI